MSWPEVITSLEMGLIYGIMAMGVFLTFRILNFPDLSGDASFVTGSAGCAVALQNGLHPFLSLLIGACAAAMAGLLTGLLHLCFRIAPLLSGILSAFMLYSINLRIMGGIPNLPLFGVQTLWGDFSALAALSGITAALWMMLSYVHLTDFGLALRSMGYNLACARSYGIPTSQMTLIVLILSNALIGLSGGLFCQYQNFSDISQGMGTVIAGLAAVMIGEKILPFRSIAVQLLSCILGSVLYRLMIAFALHNEIFGLESSDLNLITGFMIAMMMFSRSKRKN